MSPNVVADYNAVNVYTAAVPYHHGNLRAALLERAEHRLAAGAELSLRELARDAGVSHGAPRRHFADKQALLDALAQEGFERLGRTLADAASEGSFTERLAALARAYVHFALAHAALLELMFAGKHRSESLEAAADRAFAAPLALIAQGQAAGEVVAGDPERVAKVAFAAVHGLAALTGAGVLEAEDRLVDETVERLVLGLRPR
jgi:AcrR family transcriptional regulator